MYPSPEWTPPNVALAEVLMAGCLRDESLHLLRHLEALLNAIILYKPDHYKDSLTSELNSFPVSLSLCTLTSVLKSLPVSLSLTRCTISNASLLRTSGSTDSPKEVKVSSQSIEDQNQLSSKERKLTVVSVSLTHAVVLLGHHVLPVLHDALHVILTTPGH